MNVVFVVESLIKGLQFGAKNQVLNFFERLKGHNVILKISKIKRRCKTQRPLKGASLIEIMLAISILAIVILGTAFFSFRTSGQIGVGKQYLAACQLAGQKMEQLRADNEVGIGVTDGTTTEEVTSGDSSYTRTTVIEDSGSCKEVAVTVSWNQMGKSRNVSLVSLFVEK